jgi:hypothetical protein
MAHSFQITISITFMDGRTEAITDSLDFPLQAWRHSYKRLQVTALNAGVHDLYLVSASSCYYIDRA